MNRVQLGSFIYTQFGKIVDWAEDDYGIDIIGTDERTIRKSKKYPSWTTTAQKIKDHMGKPIIYRTTDSSVFSPDKYFNDIVADNDFFEIADDAGEKAKQQIFMLKLSHEQQLYYLHKKNAKDIMLLETEIETQEKTEIARATKQLDKEWDKMLTNPETEFLIYGAASRNNSLPKKVNRTFMLRMGIDTMYMKRISVFLKARIKDNLVLVELPDNDEQECLLAIAKGNNPDTRGNWVIRTVIPIDKRWFKHEKSEWKNLTGEPISFFKEKHDLIKRKLNKKG